MGSILLPSRSSGRARIDVQALLQTWNQPTRQTPSPQLAKECRYNALSMTVVISSSLGTGN
jgi:hypothetical protein